MMTLPFGMPSHGDVMLTLSPDGITACMPCDRVDTLPLACAFPVAAATSHRERHSFTVIGAM
jgi:hypothetical protein